MAMEIWSRRTSPMEKGDWKYLRLWAPWLVVPYSLLQKGLLKKDRGLKLLKTVPSLWISLISGWVFVGGRGGIEFIYEMKNGWTTPLWRMHFQIYFLFPKRRKLLRLIAGIGSIKIGICFRRGMLDRECESWLGLVSMFDPLRLRDGVYRVFCLSKIMGGFYWIIFF